jgi:hypothetical protein
MNTTTAAAQANVTVATIRTWCRRGVIAAIKTTGRWVIDAASLARRIQIGARRMSNPTEGLAEETLRRIRRAKLGRARHASDKAALTNRYVLPSIGAVSYPIEQEQGLVDILNVNGRVYYVLSDKAVAIRTQIAA